MANLVRFKFLGLAVLLSACPPCEKPEVRADSGTAARLIAHWTFDGTRPLADYCGREHELRLRGRTAVVPGGVSGGCLQTHSSGEGNDRPEGAITARARDLTPSEAFALDLWIRPTAELRGRKTAFLIDCKYIHYSRPGPEANSGYCLYLSRIDNDRYQLVANLGFGDTSAEYRSEPVTLEPGQWYRISFAYNGAGVGRLFLNGRVIGRGRSPGRGGIAPARYDLTIGDRYGSIHAGFPGAIDEVKIFEGVPEDLEGGVFAVVSPQARRVFRRREPDAVLHLEITNEASTKVENVRASVIVGRSTKNATSTQLEPGSVLQMALPVDTHLRAGTYQTRVSLEWIQKGVKRVEDVPATVHLLPVELAPRMPVVLWGSGDPATVRKLGFTHQLVHLADYRHIWEHGLEGGPVERSRIEGRMRDLDEYAIRQLGAIVYLYPVSWMRRVPELAAQYGRVDRDGKPYARSDICGNFPQVRELAYVTGTVVGRTFGAHPALEGALIHSEVRDATEVCFHRHDHDLFREFAGRDIPAVIRSKWGVRYQDLPGFPADRVLPDDDPVLVYYRWFWKQGDGWNELHSLVHRGLKEHGRGDIWTFFDPAVRAPSIWGSGGEVDVISQWTYTYPDPIKIGQACDELFAMAAGRRGQRVMKMTQIIWYRSQTAPAGTPPKTEWERREADARFITIAPDHLREAFWCKIARPVSGIMYHGWGSLVPGQSGSYRFTHPGAAEALAELTAKVVTPLGPTLLAVKDYPADVAILESFTSQMFARRGTFGWSRGWEADLHLALQWGGLQPEILYEEHLANGVPERVRVLFLPFCDVLPASTVRAIRKFQNDGGLVVGDEFLCPAIEPDLRVQSYRRSGKPDVDKRALQQLGRKLAEELSTAIHPPVKSSAPDVLVYRRTYGDSLYLFVVNDRRTFGDYVGHHGLVMEQGEPAKASITLQGGDWHVYDLVHAVPADVEAGAHAVRVNLSLGPAEGRLLMATRRPVHDIHLTVPAQARPGDLVRLQVSVVDPQGVPVPAVVPLRIELLGPSGTSHEVTGYYAAVGGQLTLEFDFAPNEAPGQWTLSVRELASGRQASADILLTTP